MASQSYGRRTIHIGPESRHQSLELHLRADVAHVCILDLEPYVHLLEIGNLSVRKVRIEGMEGMEKMEGKCGDVSLICQKNMIFLCNIVTNGYWAVM